jgi:hypothetical protein
MRKSPKFDPQRNEVYRWEKNFSQILYGHSMTSRSAHALARAMARYYGVEKPRLESVKLGKAGNTAAADGQEAIEINTDLAQWTGPVIAHEMAHIICHAYAVLEPPHGPTWLAVYLHLMDKFDIMPADGLCASAKNAGLKFTKLDKVKPGEL